MFYDEAFPSEAAATAPTTIFDNDRVGQGWVLEMQPEDAIDTYLQLTSDTGAHTEWVRDTSGLYWVRYKSVETWDRLAALTEEDSPQGFARELQFDYGISAEISVQLQSSAGISQGTWNWQPGANVALQVGAAGSFSTTLHGRYDPYDVGEKTYSQTEEFANPAKDWRSIPIIRKTRIIEQRIFDPNLTNTTPLGRPLVEVTDAAGDALVTSEAVATVSSGSQHGIIAEWYGVTGGARAQLWSKVRPEK